MHAFGQQGIALAGVQHDPLLYGYLLDPTYSTYGLRETALRKFNLRWAPRRPRPPTSRCAWPTNCAMKSTRPDCARCTTISICRWCAVLARMEEAGVKLDCEVLAEMSQRLEHDIDAKAREIYDKSGHEFNINSPKQLGDVLFNKLNLPKPMKYGKGKTISTAVDVLEGLAAEHEVPKMVLDYRQLSKLKSTYVDALPALLNSCTLRLHTTFNMAGSATGRLSSVESQPAEHSDPHRAGTRDSRRLRRRTRHVC